MNPLEMVVIIVFLGVVGSVINNLISARQDRREASQNSVREADELRDHIIDLEDRIKVLERIITDSSGREDLKRQFRELER
jgi:hypothetical protein